MHGGSAPQVLNAARVRLAMASDVLMAQLIAIATDKKEPTPVRLMAIRDALDRAGVAGKQSVEISGQVSVVDETAARVFINRDMDYDDDDPNVIDAEVVESWDIPFQPYRDADAIEPPKPADTEPLPRGRDDLAAPMGMPSVVPAHHGETYSERSERLNRESRARESGLKPRNPGGTRQSTARSGRPKPRGQS